MHRLMGDLLHDAQSSTALSASNLKDQRFRPRGGSEQPGRSGALRHALLKRTLVEPIGLRAFQRGIESSLVEAFARPLLNCGSGGLQSIRAICRSLSACAWGCLTVTTSALSRMRARFNLRAEAVPEEMSLCKYSRSFSLSSRRYFFFIAALLQRRIRLKISRSIQTSNHR
jgi:hypothetical protein